MGENLLSLIYSLEKHPALQDKTFPTKTTLPLSLMDGQTITEALIPNRAPQQSINPPRQKSSSINASTPPLASFEPDKSIIIYREFFHDEWKDIFQAIKNTAHEVCAINPIQLDRAESPVCEECFIDHLC